MAFCGVRTAHSMTGRTLYLNEIVARAAAIEVGGDRSPRGYAPLPEAPFRPDMTGAIARCMVTDRPWRPEYAVAVPRIRIPRLEFPDEDGSGFGFGWGSSVVFRGGSVHRPLP